MRPKHLIVSIIGLFLNVYTYMCTQLHSHNTHVLVFSSTLLFLTVLDNVASYTLSYNVYIDDLSQLLSGLPVAGLCGNHVSYADDMYLLSLSALGLQTLVHVCLVFAVKHDIIFNVRKPVCMLTRSRKYTY